MLEANELASTASEGFSGNAVPNQYGYQQVRVITLDKGQHLESTLYCLEKGWILEFQLGPSLFGKEISIFTNHPLDDVTDFDRGKYYLLKWESRDDDSCGNKHKDDTCFYAELKIHKAGSFNYYFGELDCEASGVLGTGYFTVKPTLCVGQNSENLLLLDSIQCQTVLTKCLGPFSEWEDRLLVSKECGYNMIHFTPVQELGGSNSSYSIKDQLQLNPALSDEKSSPTFEDLKNLVKKMQENWEVLSICDVVLNHTANESSWLLEHPECTYNMVTAPYLIPAAILDGYLHVFGKKVADGTYVENGIPRDVCTEEHLRAINYYLETELIANLQLSEYYMCNVEKLRDEFKALVECTEPSSENIDISRMQLIHDSFHGRMSATVDLEIALRIFNKRKTDVDERTRVSNCVDNFVKRLNELNSMERSRINDHLVAATNNSIAHIRYQRVQSDGPKISGVSEENPLIPRYFTGEFLDYNTIEKEVLEKGKFVMAHNGWVMNFDPLKNFATREFNVYLRRELIAWGDNVKLRYGECSSDSPFLWDHMRKYVELTADIFHGIRLDNCHSTPLTVAEYLLDCARRVRPDIYIIAELFTNSDETDNIFINRLGISSLVREAMSAWNAQEFGRLVHRYGGESVGSFHNGAVRPLVPNVAHALFYDITHDNESLIEKRSVFDCIPSAAMVNMSCCASGSTRGFDELVPHHIHVVKENRYYASWKYDAVAGAEFVNLDTGIISVKRRLNLLHKRMNDEGYSQVFVDQMNENVVAVTRHNPNTHESIVLVAYTAYAYPMNVHDQPCIKNLELEGVFENIILESCLEFTGDGGDRFSRPKNFVRDENYINGLLEYKVKIKENISVDESEMLALLPSGKLDQRVYTLRRFLPGSIIIAKLTPTPETKPELNLVINITNSLLKCKCETLFQAISKFSLRDINYALYRCSEEDAEESFGSYDIPQYGSLIYCGLQAFASLLHDIRNNNDLGHPFCQNLRQGNWMLDYISGRLKLNSNTRPLGIWFDEIFEALKKLPRYLIPTYFDVIITSVTNLLLSKGAFHMSEFVKCGSKFIRALAMGSVQCVGFVESAQMPPFSPSLELSDPNLKCLTMCAGLPHFSTGYMRSWGRDTFISLRGLLLITGRFEVARCHILGYASCLRHGLIPNLLDRGANARFNSRDAVWWWLYAITSYVNKVPNGFKILNDPVSRIFPDDSSPALSAGLADQPLHCVMQEALTVHFQGLHYRERNAGASIDANMTDLGFNSTIGVDLDTGFVFGGNEYNCGTWMDKMGSSSIACNRGRPATPRDGSAVELVGLCKAVLRELDGFYEKGWYPYDSVTRISDEGDSKMKWTFKEWEEKIVSNFDIHFWVDTTINPDEDSHLIHRRGIYKDSYDATYPWADYQFRCNFLIALAVAPEMTDPKKAWTAIKKAEEILLGPLGIKTLDPADWNYNGNYDNNDNSDNPKVAHGFNYHQGPEWIWPVGFFLRAKLHFANLQGPEELKKALSETRSYLGGFYKHIVTSHWRGLPELTNANGTHCPGSCHVQAWSMATIMEVLYDMDQLYT
ncbi:UNVERIFIED_CONTAM: hypothetical protein PYX00_004943 [Menopon gallinae]|uniref:Glycogen debranching enzyme n=1 Tax=Menopon gallinae TaxID=328185 RepID=A0AAW2I7U4_9NEOP